MFEADDETKEKEKDVDKKEVQRIEDDTLKREKLLHTFFHKAMQVMLNSEGLKQYELIQTRTLSDTHNGAKARHKMLDDLKNS